MDHFQRGVELADRFTKEDSRRAREFLHRAIELDPNYGKAFAKLSWLHLFDALYGWAEKGDEPLVRAREFATLAVERDDDEAWGHWVTGACYLFCGEAARALEAYQRALELNPNDADILAEFGSCLSYVGQAEDGLDAVQRAMRLNPHYPEWYVMIQGQILFDARRYAPAVAALEKLRGFETIFSVLYLAASHGACGHVEEGQKAVRRALEIDPGVTIGGSTPIGRMPYREPRDLAHFRDSLRKAGLPEG